MLNEADARALRLARNEFIRHGIDVSRADLQLCHGTLVVRGTLDAMAPLAKEDLMHEVDTVQRILSSRSGFRHIVMDLKTA